MTMFGAPGLNSLRPTIIANLAFSKELILFSYCLGTWSIASRNGCFLEPLCCHLKYIYGVGQKIQNLHNNMQG